MAERAQPTYRRIAIAGHNLSAWVVIPPMAKDDQAFEVEPSFLGVEFLKKTLEPLLEDGDGQPTCEIFVDPRDALKLPPPTVPPRGGSPDARGRPTNRLALRLELHELNADRTEVEVDLRASEKRRIKPPDYAIRILEARYFRSSLIDDSTDPSVRPPASFSPMPRWVDKDTLAVVFLEANQPLPALLEGELLPPERSSDDPALPGLMILHINAEKTIQPGAADQLRGYIDRCRNVLGGAGRRFVVLTDSGFFAAAGLSLVDNSSWEAVADGLTREWDKAVREDRSSPDLLTAIRRCPDVVIRHKGHSAVRFRPGRTRKEMRRQLYYLVYSEHSLSTQPGHLRGFNFLLAAALVRELVKPGAAGDGADSALDRGIKDGIYRCTLFAMRGYAARDSRDFDREWARHLLEEKPWDWVWCVDLPHLDNRTLSAGPPWSVLIRLLENASKEGDGPESRGPTPKDRALEVARDIIFEGINHAQERFHFPIVRFGTIKVIDRRTFEDYWEIQESIRFYLHAQSRQPNRKERPLSLAVFGAPGGGKSYGIKQLARTIGGRTLENPPTEVNVAQFTSIRDLFQVFQHVRDVSLTGKVPLVFFDEFDAPTEDRAFGWLRYFLAPMQDGEFGSGPRRLRFGKAIFIFVGGVNHSFEMFNGRMHNRDFIEAKGPDFVSRLARHLDVLGIDERPDDDISYLIRRAVFIRDKLLELHRAIIDVQTGKAGIDPKVVNALLGVPKFKHGMRSLEAIIQTSRVAPSNPYFHWGSLPPQEQLEMHVSVREFHHARDFPGSPSNVDAGDGRCPVRP